MYSAVDGAVDEAASLVAHDDLDLDIEPAPRSLRLLPKVALLALIFGIVASPALRPAQQEQPKRAWRSTSSESWTHGENEVPVIISVDLLSNDDVRNFVMAQAGVDDVDDLSESELHEYLPTEIQVRFSSRARRAPREDSGAASWARAGAAPDASFGLPAGENLAVTSAAKHR